MRACVRWAWEHGAEGGPRDESWRKMRHGIVFELRRLNIDRAEIKNMILAWNQKNLNPLSLNDAKRQLCGYVDWLFKKTGALLSCKALKDYCIADETGCAFARPSLIEPFDYSVQDAERFLEKIDARHSRTLIAVLRLMLSLRDETKRAVIYVGSRRLCALLFDREGMELESIEVLRVLRKLADFGFLSIQSGQAGTFGSRRANEYRMLNWRPDTTHNLSICATNCDTIIVQQPV